MSTQVGPEKNFHTVLIIAGVSLVVGSIAGFAGFMTAFGADHAYLGLRAGALISQVLVWGSVIFVGIGHWAYEGYKASRAVQVEQTMPTMTVSPDQLDQPLTSETGATAQPQRQVNREEVVV